MRAPDKPIMRRLRGRPSGAPTSATRRLRRLFETTNRHVAAMAIRLLDDSRRGSGRRSRPLSEKDAVCKAIELWNERWGKQGGARPNPENVTDIVRKGKSRSGDLARLFEESTRETWAFIKYRMKLRAAGHVVPEIGEKGWEGMYNKWLAHPTPELDEIAEKSSHEIIDEWCACLAGEITGLSPEDIRDMQRARRMPSPNKSGAK
jgi:hypothetical protein